jgi:hypothetical protein
MGFSGVSVRNPGGVIVALPMPRCGEVTLALGALTSGVGRFDCRNRSGGWRRRDRGWGRRAHGLDFDRSMRGAGTPRVAIPTAQRQPRGDPLAGSEHVRTGGRSAAPDQG